MQILFTGDYPQWGPDGQTFTFTRVVNGFDQIFVFDEGRNLLTQITVGDFNNLQPSWSGDGGRLVFSTDRKGDPDVYTVGKGGTGLVQVTQGPTTDSWPTWADDENIYFVSNADGKIDIWRARFEAAN